jgi:DNA primase
MKEYFLALALTIASMSVNSNDIVIMNQNRMNQNQQPQHQQQTIDMMQRQYNQQQYQQKQYLQQQIKPFIIQPVPQLQQHSTHQNNRQY